MLRWILVSAVLAGCGFQASATQDAGVRDGAPDVAVDGAVDAPDAAVIDCFARWRDGSVALSAPKELLDLSTGGDERDPWISADRLTLYFASQSTGDFDIYRSDRDLPTQPFVRADRLVNLNVTQKRDDRAALSGDERIVVLSSDRAANRRFAIYLAGRQDPTIDFPSADQRHLGAVNTGAVNHRDPFLTADGLSLYLAPDPDGVPGQRIVVATRPATTSDFTAPVIVPGIHGFGELSNADPALSPDERLIVFTSTRPAGGTHLWYATRQNVADEFGAPAMIPNVNGTATDEDPMLSADGCELYFASTRNGGDRDLFVAQVVP